MATKDRKDWLRQVRDTFVTKGYFQSSWNRNICNEFWSIWVRNTFAYRLHLFGHNCGSQIVMKIGRNIYPVHDAVSQKKILSIHFHQISHVWMISYLWQDISHSYVWEVTSSCSVFVLSYPKDKVVWQSSRIWPPLAISATCYLNDERLLPLFSFQIAHTLNKMCFTQVSLYLCMNAIKTYLMGKCL